jgi:hypothetical protein
MEQQYMAALGRANEVRLERAEVHRRVKAGLVGPEEILRLAPVPSWARRLEIGEFLTWVPGIGPSRAEKLMKGLCRPTLRLEHMGRWTTERLIERLALYREHLAA